MSQFNKNAAETAAKISDGEKAKIAVVVSIKEDGSLIIAGNPALSYEQTGDLLFKAAITCKGHKQNSGLFIPKTGLS